MHRAAGLAFLVLAGSVPLRAQVTKLSDLDLGTMVAGTGSTVAPTSPYAAHWRLNAGAIQLLAGFSLSLPAVLTRVGGSETMPVTFSSTSGIWKQNSTNPVGGTTFNPANNVCLPSAIPCVLGISLANKDIHVWLGGAVSPPANQKGGSYRGTVTLNLLGLTL